MKRLILIFILIGLFAVSLPLSMAQEGVAQTPTETPSGSTTTGESTVQIFVVICETSAVVNFSGVMQPGYDVYYQVFNAANGGGTAITALRRVSVNGQYAISEVIDYNSGSSIAASGTGSVFVSIARENNSNSSVYSTTVNDVQDGCNTPQNPTTTSVSAGGGSTSSSSSGVSSRSGILTPFGGVLDVAGSQAQEPLVVVGARESAVAGRNNNPGLIFAECDQFLDRAAPGLVYDSDNVIIFWSWFTRTDAQMAEHLANANYAVTLNRAPLPYLQQTPPQRIGGNTWVFFYQQIGNLAPGSYGVEYKLSWANPVFDGYDDYGPGTENPTVSSTCTFNVVQNPNRTPVDYNLMYSVR